MIVRLCYFTEQGKACAERLSREWQDVIWQIRPRELALAEWTAEGFGKHLPVLFIGACGIAVRTIAPFVKDKLEDSPVVVMDERGQYVIPVLSGHMGGANALAVEIAKRMQAQVVLTTATDVEQVFSVDVFARKNGFEILHREGIRLISAKLLRGESISVAIDPAIEVCHDCTLPQGLVLVDFAKQSVDLRISERQALEKGEFRQSLCLVAKEYVIGLGCKKGKTFEELRDFMQKHCPYDPQREVYALASIDLKEREEGLNELAQYYHIPFQTFSAQALESVEGEFSESAFVRDVTGVSNVCERAALCAANDGELLQKKIAENGMTLAIARRKPRIITW